MLVQLLYRFIIAFNKLRTYEQFYSTLPATLVFQFPILLESPWFFFVFLTVLIVSHGFIALISFVFGVFLRLTLLVFFRSGLPPYFFCNKSLKMARLKKFLELFFTFDVLIDICLHYFKVNS